MEKTAKNQKNLEQNENLQENPTQQPTIKKNSETKKVVEETKIREFDATGKVLGRLATEIADALRGKDKPTFLPYLIMGDIVVVNNASKIVITGQKLEQKLYYHHTGYLGHLKSISMKELMQKNPSEVLKKAVYGMLPKNKLRDGWMKNLTINN